MKQTYAGKNKILPVLLDQHLNLQLAELITEVVFGTNNSCVDECLKI